MMEATDELTNASFPTDTTVKTLMNDDSNKNTTKKEVALCMKRNFFFGRTSNRLLTIARGLKMARQLSGNHGAKLVLMAGKWFRFFPQILEPHPDIYLAEDATNYSCEHTMNDRDVYKSFELDIGKEMRELMPLRKLRQNAVEILHNHFNISPPTISSEEVDATSSDPFQQLQRPLPFISVHRRWLEGQCGRYANDSYTIAGRRTTNLCNTSLMNSICELSLSSLPFLAPKVFERSLNNSERTIILFTDGQVPEKDGTFPIQYDTKISVGTCGPRGGDCQMVLEIIMMTLSEYHVGNPVSTVDTIVQGWRGSLPWWQTLGDEPTQDHAAAGMIPSGCFL
eukprot:CAMPEP_0168741994 /NCGR_PEP_ID=MMETSP0724-20121128/12809_1 /TAXON_ID=265536 /ORGANISM="Amphiprora sp., Strain CCMP467" /LENGTH=338 /DNA_ID=CAMNT_0008789533 /DNA_START=178 /DNA_END=1197 /DNA_ORIENTATION=-